MNGSRVVATPHALNRDKNLDVTLDMTSERAKELYEQYYKGGSEFNSLLAVKDATAGAGSRDAVFTLSGCRILEMDIPSSFEGANEQSLTIGIKTFDAVVDDEIELYNAW